MALPLPSMPTSHKRTLPGLPDTSADPKRQFEALKRVEDEANKRVQLGMQLYRAAESHTAHQQSLLDGFKEDQQRLKDELEQDVTRSLHAYDQWVGKIDEDFTNALKSLESRIDTLQDQWSASQQRIDDMMRRSEALLDQSRTLVRTAVKQIPPGAAPVAEPAPSDPPPVKGEIAKPTLQVPADAPDVTESTAQAVAAILAGAAPVVSDDDQIDPPQLQSPAADGDDANVTGPASDTSQGNSATSLYRDILEKMDRDDPPS